MGSLSTCMNANFDRYFDDFWAYLKHAFGKEKELDLFKASLSALADISRSLGSKFNKQLDTTVKFLITCLNKNMDRSIKVLVFECFGCISLGA